MAKYWRKPYRRKDGTWVPGHWVGGKNPKAGCQMWLLGMAACAAVVHAGRRRLSR